MLSPSSTQVIAPISAKKTTHRMVNTEWQWENCVERLLRFIFIIQSMTYNGVSLTYISFFLNFMTLNQQYIFNGKYISNMDLWEIEIYGGMLCHDAEQKESKLSLSALPYASHMFISISTQYCAVCCCLVAMLYEGHCMHFWINTSLTYNVFLRT